MFSVFFSVYTIWPDSVAIKRDFKYGGQKRYWSKLDAILTLGKKRIFTKNQSTRSIVPKTKGAFHSIKTFQNLETAANDTEISRKSFHKFRNCWMSEIRTIQPTILENPGAKFNGGKKTSGKTFSKSCFFSTLEDKFRFSARPSNILYICKRKLAELSSLSWILGKTPDVLKTLFQLVFELIYRWSRGIWFNKNITLTLLWI